jgi:hypothetical protein
MTNDQRRNDQCPMTNHQTVSGNPTRRSGYLNARSAIGHLSLGFGHSHASRELRLRMMRIHGGVCNAAA